MPRYCFVEDCQNQDVKAVRLQGVTFHRIPQKPKFRDAWLRALKKNADQYNSKVGVKYWER